MSSQATVDDENIDIVTGLAGVGCGLAQAGGVEPETTLKVSKKRTAKNFNNNTTIYEWFSDGDKDYDGVDAGQGAPFDEVYLCLTCRFLTAFPSAWEVRTILQTLPAWC